MVLLKKYVSLGEQAENIDTYDSYKEEIDIIRNMTYEEMYNIMRDTETALKVLVRDESKASKGGLVSLTKDIVALGTLFVEKYLKTAQKEDVEYVYEYIERRGCQDYDKY